MSQKRRRFGSCFKAKVALESVREVRTISELAKKHKLHATQINLWKKQLVEGAESIFDGDQKPSKESQEEPQELSNTRRSISSNTTPEPIVTKGSASTWITTDINVVIKDSITKHPGKSTVPADQSGIESLS